MLLEDFYEDILKKLGVLAAEESPTASDRQEAVTKYGQVLAEYAERDLATWFDDEEVPDEVADGFAAMVALRLTDTFTVSSEKYARLVRAAMTGETQLISRGQRRELPPQEKDYY